MAQPRARGRGVGTQPTNPPFPFSPSTGHALLLTGTLAWVWDRQGARARGKGTSLGWQARLAPLRRDGVLRRDPALPYMSSHMRPPSDTNLLFCTMPPPVALGFTFCFGHGSRSNHLPGKSWNLPGASTITWLHVSATSAVPGQHLLCSYPIGTSSLPTPHSRPKGPKGASQQMALCITAVFGQTSYIYTAEKQTAACGSLSTRHSKQVKAHNEPGLRGRAEEETVASKTQSTPEQSVERAFLAPNCDCEIRSLPVKGLSTALTRWVALHSVAVFSAW